MREKTMYGDTVVVCIRVGDPSACINVQRPKASKMIVLDGTVDLNEPNVDFPKASCKAGTFLDKELARARVIWETESKRLNKGKGAPAKEMIDRDI
jgi:hypothetical protein